MSHFEWSDERSIHLPEVDAEHRTLYRCAMELNRALSKGVRVQVIAKWRVLLAEAEDHLQHEERLMRAAHYSLYEWHKGQHDTLRKRAAEHEKRILLGEAKAGKEFLEFLGRWLADHVAVADNMMGAALRNHQRSHAA
ncbi:MAG TPA: hemerythrin family protein [Candidatus Sulfopaludibacter sp.]|jgi:hemerythrin-like metal-binding protein|nr:hemerythrin family protein [Candidatus Sulfopaludibacter sp.]